MRKNFTLVVIFLCFCLPLLAQFEKGTRLIGGTLSLEKDRTSDNGLNDVKNTAFTFRPSAGIFYRTNRLAGVNLVYSYSKYPSTTNKYRLFGGGLFVRQYLPVGKRFYIFADESLNIQQAKSEVRQVNYKSDDKTTRISISFFAGLAFNLTKKFQLELSLPTLASLSYTRQERSVYETIPQGKTTTKSFRLQTGTPDTSISELGFGVRFVL